MTGIPLQYNLLTLDPESGVMTVETRKKEKADGAWAADARWGDKNNPVPRYHIELKYGTSSKTDNSSSQLKASTQDNRPNVSQNIFGGNVNVGGNINILASVNQINQIAPQEDSDDPNLKKKDRLREENAVDVIVQRVQSHCCEKIQNLYSKIQLLNRQQIDVDLLYVDVYVLQNSTSDSNATIPGLLKDANLRNDFDRLGLNKRNKRSPGLMQQHNTQD